MFDLLLSSVAQVTGFNIVAAFYLRSVRDCSFSNTTQVDLTGTTRRYHHSIMLSTLGTIWICPKHNPSGYTLLYPSMSIVFLVAQKDRNMII
jgi:hypothetical protein